MDLDEIQRKFPRISNGDGRLDSAKVVYGKKMDGQYGDEVGGKSKRGGGSTGGGSVGGVDLGGGAGGFYGWASSRIVRVSRASGGKDRHSKVLTSKGLRDRRVRLSVNTAIQFYDLQDRLGYDQPSKAVEWLLKAAASSIAELPPMNSLFPDTPKQLSDEKRSSNGGSDQLGLDSVEVEMDGDGGGGDTKYNRHQQMTKSSACSSTSETSKSSGLSLSRSESRIKARVRAKERVAGKEKEKENESSHIASLSHLSHTTSFTELLSAGMNSNNPTSPNRSVQENSNGVNANESNFFQKSRLWSSTPMEYFSTGPGQIHFANSFASMASPLFSVAGENQTEIQQFSFVPEHFVPASNSNSSSNQNNGSNEYNLNFTISSSANSSGLAAYNGGTLQSNSTSPSMLPYNYLQRFSLIDGTSSPSIFLGTAAPVENHHQFLPGFDARLQLSYGDPNPNNSASRHSSQKGKGKN